MSKDNDKMIKVSLGNDITVKDAVELRFAPGATSAEITQASIEIAPMEKNEEKFFQQTIENGEKFRISKWGISFG